MTSISEAADNAADYITEHGHLKHDLGDPGGPACLRGAVLWSNECMDDMPICAAVTEYLNLPNLNYGIDEIDKSVISRAVDWNNAEERTQEEVVQVLRDVATKYRDDAMHG